MLLKFVLLLHIAVSLHQDFLGVSVRCTIKEVKKKLLVLSSLGLFIAGFGDLIDVTLIDEYTQNWSLLLLMLNSILRIKRAI